MLAQQRQEALKLSAWEDILRKLGERLRHLEPAQMVEWVTQAIHQQQDPHPRIYVGTRWMQPIFTAFGRRYQVIERKDLRKDSSSPMINRMSIILRSPCWPLNMSDFCDDWRCCLMAEYVMQNTALVYLKRILH